MLLSTHYGLRRHEGSNPRPASYEHPQSATGKVVLLSWDEAARITGGERAKDEDDKKVYSALRSGLVDLNMTRVPLESEIKDRYDASYLKDGFGKLGERAYLTMWRTSGVMMPYMDILNEGGFNSGHLYTQIVIYDWATAKPICGTQTRVESSKDVTSYSAPGANAEEKEKNAENYLASDLIENHRKAFPVEMKKLSSTLVLNNPIDH